MLTLLAISAFVALVSFDVTKTAIFRPLRVALARRTPRRLRKVWRCHYCLSHHVGWLTLLALGWYYPFGTRLDPVLTWAAVVVLANPMMTGIDWAIDATDSFKRLFRIADVPKEEEPAMAYETENRFWEPGRRILDGAERLQGAGEYSPSN